MPNKQDFPRSIGLLLGVDERSDWYSTEGKVRAEFGDDIGPLLGVPRGRLTKVGHMKAILESVGVEWIPGRHSSELTRRPGGNVRKEAYADLLEALQEALGEEASATDSESAGALANDYIKRLVKYRLRQGTFRTALLRAYESKCSISGSPVAAVLDAAHIKPFSKQGDQVVTNGLLLRKDLHALFDAGLIAIDATTWTVLVSESLNGTDYEKFRGQPLMVPKKAAARPNVIAVQDHRASSGL